MGFGWGRESGPPASSGSPASPAPDCSPPGLAGQWGRREGEERSAGGNREPGERPQGAAAQRPEREGGQEGGQGAGEKVGEDGPQEWAEPAEAGRGEQGHPTRAPPDMVAALGSQVLLSRGRLPPYLSGLEPGFVKLVQFGNPHGRETRQNY